jgi:mannitol-specific phosphotransferase system IIBC component
VIVVHAGLADRARGVAPGKPVIAFQVFLGDPAVTKTVEAIKNGTDIDG